LQDTFDVVLLDFDLDDGKGVELLHELLEINPRPRVIATSSHQAGNDALLAAGAEAVCRKLRFGTIESVINEQFAQI
jgi:DNA-binding NarL/FixJ family response regulator